MKFYEGAFTYGIPPPETPGLNPKVAQETLFDMASCTKVLATTSAAAQFYERGEIDLDMPVSDPSLLGPRFASNGKATITSRNLLLHNAGFPPDPSPNYNEPAFGCPESLLHSPPEDFLCRNRIFDGLMSQVLVNPVGQVYVYSDLSMITMMFVVGRLAKDRGYVAVSDLRKGCLVGTTDDNWQCYYEAYVRKYVLQAANVKYATFLPDASLWKNAAPTWNDTTFQHRVIQGAVSDGNAYILGGISGHAGLFANLDDTIAIISQWAFAPPGSSKFLNATTVAYFTKVYNVTQSSRALGFDTMASSQTFMYCGSLSSRTYGHLGYTGTEVCVDPDRKILTVLLTNRVYPDTANVKIEEFRITYNSLLQKIWDEQHSLL